MSEVVLPEGWASINLERIANIILGQSPDGQSVNELGQGIIFFQGKTEFGKIYPTPRKFCTSPKKIAEAGDILLSVRAPVGPTNFASQRCAIGRGLSAIRGFNGIDQLYLMYFFKSIEMWLSEQGTGTTFKAISGDFIREINVCLPPLAEQKVIAEKLDELLAQVDILKTRLTTIPTLLKRFRQSVLAAAVSGKLTEEWREAKGLEWKWRELLLSDITSSVTYGYTASSTQNEVGPRMLRITDIQDGRVDWDNVPYCEIDEDRKDTYLLQKGDLVFARTGATVGKSFLIRDTPPDAVFASYLIRVRCNVGNSIEYLSYFFQSNNYWRQITEFSAGIGQPNVNGTKLKNLAIPLPPLEEQTEIVRRVEQLFAYADQIEQQVKNAQNRVNNLTQSILDKAFRGELTADWRAANPHLISGENSAQALLAKIKAERDKPKKTSKQQAMFNE
ncbi:MAG: restriction endonuclease subunit S [Agitococcus sp.]